VLSTSLPTGLVQSVHMRTCMRVQAEHQPCLHPRLPAQWLCRRQSKVCRQLLPAVLFDKPSCCHSCMFEDNAHSRRSSVSCSTAIPQLMY
jgi:hypothetical protein